MELFVSAIVLMVLVWIIEHLLIFVAYTFLFIIDKLERLVCKVKNTFGSKKY